jgi:hypothetical protein
MARARLQRISPKGPKRSRNKRVAWNTPRLRLLLKRDKRSVVKISEEESLGQPRPAGLVISVKTNCKFARVDTFQRARGILAPDNVNGPASGG